ncbi:MAG: GTPase HflX [Opitutae bacterium]|jgi:GTPase|nr:GTPase HflX [Opitutae bacterium]MBT5716772.1 GTPase HflX [Opitutae bacterium]
MFEVKEKPKKVERAFLISVIQRKEEELESVSLLAELSELVENLSISVKGKIIVRNRKTFPGHILGKGKCEQIYQQVKDLKCDVIIFDNEITPGQQRNWEELTKVLVIDRHEVILDVFAERAQTKEAVLQVRLARLEYSLPRLRRAWTHLDRQKGGGVTQRGDGEAQIELDQRMLRDKISATKKEIIQVASRRVTSRKKRKRIPLATLAIVGYTNAGKSTLLNQITGSRVLSENKLFATLDPTSRKAILPGGRTVILTDTVGFIRKLPHRLIDAFKATLEEALVADLLLHVVDFSCPEFEEQLNTTIKVLEELGAAEKEVITVYNKIDQGEQVMSRLRAKSLTSKCVFISCKSGDGMPDLLKLVEQELNGKVEIASYKIPHNRYELVAKLREQGCVLSELNDDTGVEIKASPRGKLKSVLRDFVV